MSIEEEGKTQVDWKSGLGEKASRLKNLTLVDCNITGLSTILNSLGEASLEQLIIIFNEDTEEPNDDLGVPLIFNELMEARMQNFKRLRYFEFSLYNNAEEPSFS